MLLYYTIGQCVCIRCSIVHTVDITQLPLTHLHSFVYVLQESGSHGDVSVLCDVLLHIAGGQAGQLKKQTKINGGDLSKP